MEIIQTDNMEVCLQQVIIKKFVILVKNIVKSMFLKTKFFLYFSSLKQAPNEQK